MELKLDDAKDKFDLFELRVATSHVIAGNCFFSGRWLQSQYCLKFL